MLFRLCGLWDSLIVCPNVLGVKHIITASAAPAAMVLVNLIGRSEFRRKAGTVFHRPAAPVGVRPIETLPMMGQETCQSFYCAPIRVEALEPGFMDDAVSFAREVQSGGVPVIRKRDTQSFFS